mmetsp:Transcript_28000/g.55111  ORF Transcript_28000/g.55111 Transcript_28000/m.55111 type:complete len:282 (+) Transcript_28000:28-873(+)
MPFALVVLILLPSCALAFGGAGVQHSLTCASAGFTSPEWLGIDQFTFGSALQALRANFVGSTTTGGSASFSFKLSQAHTHPEKSSSSDSPTFAVSGTWEASEGALTLASSSSDLFLSLKESAAGVFEGFLRNTSSSQSRPVAMTCWPANNADAGVKYRYNAATGQCLDSAGVEGRNQQSVQFLRETGKGECADLSNIPSMNENELSYPTLKWDLRGALVASDIAFADLEGQFQGADMRKLTFGYAALRGTTDQFTQVPESCVGGLVLPRIGSSLGSLQCSM